MFATYSLTNCVKDKDMPIVPTQLLGHADGSI